MQLDLPCQRWRRRRDSYRPAGEPIDPSRYGVEPIDSDRVARDFVREHHYSGSYPAARARAGLYEVGKGLVGVAVFSVSAQARAARRWTGTSDAVELGRFVLLDEVPANGETWFLARAFRVVREQLEDARAVYAYSDPMPRETAGGRLVKPGHVGTIYRAFNGRRLGRSSRETLWLDPQGQVVSRRSLSKIRNGERGAQRAYERFVAAGAPPIRRGEPAADYVRRALLEGPFRRLRHPGNLVYAWPLEKRLRLPEAA